MYLKKIEIQGFKSFADKTEINFKEGVTGIVGPNGSGKSNISDAIRWVLGEQSVRTLRGNKMEDVIFSGTSNRKALGFSEVTITFDNKDGLIPLEYQEVAITRRMFRSGESEYYINKNSCRLKDIREIFMDTGVGKDGYSIIGQGRVDEILSDRPEDRRLIFEEAAGIVKYKTKKEISERKLEKTNENLTRIEDILNELKRQLNHLEKQAKKANQYIDLSKELKSLEVNLYIREIDKLKEEIKHINEEIQKVDKEIKVSLKEKENVESKFNLMKTILDKLDLSIQTLQDEFMDLMKRLNQQTNDIKLFKEQERFLLKDRERIKEEIKGIKLNKEKKLREKEKLQEENATINQDLKSLKKDSNKLEEKLNEIKENIEKGEKLLSEKKDKLIEYNNNLMNRTSTINNYSSFEDNILKRISQLENEIKDINSSIEENKKLIDSLNEEEEKKDQESIEKNRFLTELKLDKTRYETNLNNLYKDLNNLKGELQGKISNFNLLRNMEEDYEGYYKSVKNLMIRCKTNNNLREKILGIIVDLIKVEEKYEKAIDIALGSSLQNIVTANESDAKYIIDYLREHNLGRITFLPLSTIKGKKINISREDREKYSILGLGSELIQYNPKYNNIMDYLLGRTIIVRNLDDGMGVAKRFNHRYRIITLDGDTINVGGSMTGGSLPKIRGNLLSRRLQINNLKKEINQLNQGKNQLENKIEIEEKGLNNLLSKINEESDSLQKLNIQLVKLENEKSKGLEELERNKNLIDKYKEEILALNKELVEIKDNKTQFSNEIKLLEEKVSNTKEDMAKLTEKLEEKKITRDKLIKELNKLELNINLLENEHLRNKAKIEEIIAEIDLLETNKANKIREDEKNKKDIKELIDNILIGEENLKTLKEDEIRTKESLNKVQDEKNKLMDNYYSMQEKLKEINDKINKYEKMENQWKIKLTKSSIELENIYGRLLNDYELDYEGAKDLLVEIEDVEKVKGRIKELRKKIRALGNINLSAIEEYEKTLDRFDFINMQHKDLLSAKSDLMNVIEDMEKKMKEQFIYNFNLINKKFNKVFSILFNGGKAQLKLSNEEDLLNSGIEINAQPPGKKLQNLNLLSGGEKSLTAVALLFAILQVKPTPFCILDEIDAALDEANINRYTSFLKSLSQDTQFIIITHKRSTMEMADVLYGVTMEEEGVSKVISIELTDNMDEIAS